MTCFGREELLDRIVRRALDLKAGYRQNLALVGPPLIGKSSVLLRSLELLKQSPPLLPVYIELRAEASVAEFAEQFASTLLYRYWSAQGREAPQTFEALYALCHPYLPQTTELLALSITKARRGLASALTLLFEAPGRLRQESGRLCVIMLDEFHRLAAWEKAGSLTALGQQVVVQKETMYLLASSSVDDARRILQERLALLFGHFEVIAVGPFDLATGVRFLADHAGLAALGPAALIVLADLTEGHPFYLECVAQAVKAAGPTDGAASSTLLSSEVPRSGASSDRSFDRFRIVASEVEPRLGAALEALLFRPTGVLAQQCREAVERIPVGRRAACLPILLAVANGHHRVSAIAVATGRPPREVARAVRTLAAAELVVRRGVFCCIVHRLLRFWLIASYQIQHGPVHLDPLAGRQAFTAAVRQLLDQSTARAPQTVLETVAELMRRFQNELVEIRGRRLRLPKLDVHTLLLPGIPRAVVGRRDAGPWFCVPYTTLVREGDAVALVQTLRHVSKPWRRRIVIALAGVEINAKLLLQEQRFWVWDLGELNDLLELYGVPCLLPTELQEVAAVMTVPPVSGAETPSAEGQEASA